MMFFMTNNSQGIFWLLTIPAHDFLPYLPDSCQWLKCQLELAASGFLHWQCCVAFKDKKRLRSVKEVFGQTCHAELSRSSAAGDYCWKEDTAVPETRYELGRLPFRRNSKTDWERVWSAAQSGDIMSIPASARVINYRTLRAIGSDYSRPIGMERECFVYWGPTGTGKSRRAWEEAGMDAYCKDPRTKFWCGYQAEAHVIIDEFRGGIDIAHLLRWLDRYPVRVEVKGSSQPLNASKFWITSNVRPADWYPLLDPETLAALERRLTIIEF